MAKVAKPEKAEEKPNPKVVDKTADKITYTASVKRIANKLEMSPTVVAKVLKGLGDEITAVLVKDGHFRYASFGSFTVKTLPPRVARNPRTGDSIEVGERKKVRWRAGTHMSAAVCGEEVVEEAAKPVAKPTAKPAAKPTAKPAAKPTAKPAAKPTAKPAKEPETAPASESEDFEI